MVFVMLSFFTVYREGFETVLFYQAIFSFAKYMEWYVVTGMISGLAVIIGVAIVVRKIGKKLTPQSVVRINDGYRSIYVNSIYW